MKYKVTVTDRFHVGEDVGPSKFRVSEKNKQEANGSFRFTNKMHFFYRPQKKLWEFILHVCHSVHGGGGRGFMMSLSVRSHALSSMGCMVSLPVWPHVGVGYGARVYGPREVQYTLPPRY